ncbi:MAG TPA: AAC(3) family N-acetyltransferase [Anaerolineae bacterium]|nr:AAC(3) family N-acetyltransferase [Anaerolineae bacterium]
MTLIVHSSLRSIGKVMGGTVSVILALERNIGERGTRAGQYLQGGGGRAAG